MCIKKKKKKEGKKEEKDTERNQYDSPISDVTNPIDPSLHESGDMRLFIARRPGMALPIHRLLL